MEPVAWLYERHADPRDNMLKAKRLHMEAMAMAQGWTETPLVPASELERVRQENERLREALAEVVEHDPATSGLYFRTVGELLASAISKARNALEDTRCID